jgi:hypothetical protein
MTISEWAEWTIWIEVYDNKRKEIQLEKEQKHVREAERLEKELKVKRSNFNGLFKSKK